MGRKTEFSDTDVFATVGGMMARRGAITTTDVQDATRLSTGSLYHRFGSREGLLAETWLNSLRSFQPYFLAVLRDPASSIGAIAAATPRFCREHRAEALVLTCCNARQFIGSGTPPRIAEEIEALNGEAGAALIDYAARGGHALAACRIGFAGFPLGAVQMYLPDRDVPEYVDAYVAQAAEVILGMAKPLH